MRRGASIRLGSLPTYRLGIDAYDPAKLGLGKLMVQVAGAGEAGYAGPCPVGLARPMEQSVATASQFPWAMQWQNNAAGEIDWVFLADLSTAAATRRINAYTFNRRTGAFNWKGFVTVTFPGTSEAKTIRAFHMTYRMETTGTASASGTSVTGSSTRFLANRVCVGNRIGWPTTPGDPSTVPEWYEIASISSDTGLTLTTSAGTIANSNYIIEDLRAVLGVTSVTTSLGGLYLCKGLRFELFSAAGGTVPAAASTDNVRATYFLKDAATATTTTTFGIGLAEPTSATDQKAFLLHNTSNPVAYRFNIRAALTVAAGASTSAIEVVTGSGGALTGTPSQLNNAKLATAAHGPRSGVQSLYFTTNSRVYAAPTSGITAGSTTWLTAGSVMTEVPPGGIDTFAATGAMSAIDYIAPLDRFIIVTGATQRNYVTQFRTDGGQFDRIFGVNTFQIDQSTADSSTTPLPSQSGAAYTVYSSNGMLYIATAGTSASNNRLYAIPMGADWEYAASTNCRLILPAITLTNPRKIAQFFAQKVQVLGGATGKNLGLNTEPFRMYYRTTGIADNSGSWTPLDSTGSVAVAAGSQVQLMLEFRTIGTLQIPARICAVGVLYDDNGMSEHWQGSSNIGTNLANKRFGFRHAIAYGAAVPRLQVELFDAESGLSLGADDTTIAAWTWEKSTDGGISWGAMDMNDRANADTYVRVTPPSLADNIKVRAVLREY